MRADLVALTPEAIAALANVGLVKRAQKEIAEGKGPTLGEEPDGTVVGRFDDGVTTHLAPGKALRDTRCTCVASGVCRHRVAVALAYAAFAARAAGATTEPPEGATRTVERDARAPWSPSAITDAALEAVLTKRALDEARVAARRGIAIEVVRATGSEPPTARLPSCTVRFLVPRDVVYARCDCALGQGCAHVALAVWAFRVADASADATRASLIVAVTGASATGAAAHPRATTKAGPGPSARTPAEAAALTLVEDVLAGGVAQAREALAQRFVLAREALAADRQLWMIDALDDLELALERYRKRSARYRAHDVLALAAELTARSRAARAALTSHAELPREVVLGQGEAAETKLDRVRLVALGCHFEADDDEGAVEVLLADPDTGTVLVLAKAWTFEAGAAPPSAPELARRATGAGSVRALAEGQVVSRVAKRRANRAVAFGANTLGATSLVPQTGDLGILPEPLRVDAVASLATTFAARAPRLVRPRVRAEDVHVVRVGAVREVLYDVAAQTLVAALEDGEGDLFIAKKPHRRIAPHAVDELGRALLGAHGAVRWIAGPVRVEAQRFVIDPTMVVADRVVVPDVLDGRTADLPRGRIPVPADAVGQRLEAAWSLLEEVVQLGPRGVTTTFEARVTSAVRELGDYGLKGLADLVLRAGDAVVAAKAGTTPGPDAARAAVRAVIDAAIRLDLARERHA